MRRLAFVSSISLLVVSSCVGDDPATQTTSDGDAGQNQGDGGSQTDGASGGDGSTARDSGTDGEPALADVDGNVLDTWGFVVTGAIVRVGSTQATTTADGHFHLAAIPSTYDVDVVSTNAQGGKEVMSFRGLTTRSPRLQVPASYGVSTATIQGTVTAPAGGHFLNATDQTAAFDFEQPTLGGWNNPPTTGSFSATAVFFGPTFSGNIWFFETTGSGSYPASFVSYQRFPIVALPANGTQTGVTVSTTALTTSSIAGSVTFPSGFSSVDLTPQMRAPTESFGHLVGETNVGSTFTINVPKDGSNFAIDLSASTSITTSGISDRWASWHANISLPATGITFTFPTISHTSTPPNASSGVTQATLFSWSASSGTGVYSVSIACGSGASSYNATLYTTGTSAKFSDASAIGAGWPVTASCTYGVAFFTATKTTDDLTLPNALNVAEPSVASPTDGSYVSSNGSTFTTQ